MEALNLQQLLRTSFLVTLICKELKPGPCSRLVRAYDVPDHGPAQRALSAALAAPLLQGALVAHAHVSAHIQHSVDRVLVADSALCARRDDSAVLFGPADWGRVRAGVRYGLEQKKKID